MGNAQETVEHPGAGIGRIFADREHGAETRFLLGGAAQLESALAEGDAPRRQIVVERHARQGHGKRHAARQQLA